MNKVVLITGGSSGIGKVTAKLLAKNGYKVYAAARRVEKMIDLKSAGISIIEMDVTNDESIVKGVNQILAAEGKVDILINNAGYGHYGPIEDVPMSDARYQLEVNLFGLARLTQLVLPKMREQHYGKIVNISSTGGKVAGPIGGWYHASKFALEGLSDSLRMEVKQFGIDVIVIEPGGVKTEWGEIAVGNAIKTADNSAYKKLIASAQRINETEGAKSAEPVVIAEVIKKAIEAGKPKIRYVKGHLAKPILFMRKLLNDRALDKVILSQLK